MAAEPVVFPEDEPAAAVGASPCTTVSVISSFENAEMVSRLADGYNAQPRDVDGTCVTVVASKDKSGLVAEDAARNFKDLPEEQRPTVWVPDASSWIGLSRADRRRRDRACRDHEHRGIRHRAGHARSARGRHRLAGRGPTWAEVYEAADDENAWSDLGHPEWGAFKLGKTSPLVASSGEAALLSSYALGRRLRGRPDSGGDPRPRRDRGGQAARTRDEPLHGDARALPLACAPVRGDRVRSPTSSPR